MTNKELISIANMELRDQLQAKDEMIKKLKKELEIAQRMITDTLDEFIYIDWNDKETRDKNRMKNIEKLQKVVNDFKSEVSK